MDMMPVIGCFCDPSWMQPKEACDRMVVVGVMEAAVTPGILLRLISFPSSRQEEIRGRFSGKPG